MGVGTVGRSEPAFHGCQHLCTPPHLPARREADVICSCCFCCKAGQLWAVRLRPEPGGESAGCVCLQCLFCGLCACCSPFACHAHCPHHLPPSSLFAPVQFILLLLLALFMSMCARIDVVQPSHNIMFASCETVPLAAATRACSGGPCTGPFLTYLLFPAESMILGHGSSVNL